MGFSINDDKLFVPSKTIKLSNLVVFNLVAHILQKQFDILKSLRSQFQIITILFGGAQLCCAIY